MVTMALRCISVILYIELIVVLMLMLQSVLLFLMQLQAELMLLLQLLLLMGQEDVLGDRERLSIRPNKNLPLGILRRGNLALVLLVLKRGRMRMILNRNATAVRMMQRWNRSKHNRMVVSNVVFS